MNISLFFDPVSEEYININSEFSSFENAFYINTTGSLNWKEYNIALFGVNEFRGNEDYEFQELNAADQIRKQLYKLNKSEVQYKICDLGNLRPGETTQDTYERLREVCETLIENNVIPIILGGTNDLSIGQYYAYQKQNKLVTLLNIDAQIDMKNEESSISHNSYLSKIILHEPNFLFNYIQLAYQSYIIDPPLLNVFEKLNFEHYRLGSLRDKFEEIEPIIRQSNMICIDLGAVKIQDAPAQLHNRPFGLTGEEICRIAWYAGLSEKANSFGIYEYYPSKDHSGQTANLIATVIWYFIEGYYHRVPLENFSSDAFISYKASVNGNDILTFHKHKYTEKWWMQVPRLNQKTENEAYVIVPCSYSDYISATNGDLPDRWIQTQARLI